MCRHLNNGVLRLDVRVVCVQCQGNLFIYNCLLVWNINVFPYFEVDIDITNYGFELVLIFY